jgi:elongation factor G
LETLYLEDQMAELDTKNIRNIALIGHGGSGKTILAEVMLNKCGQTNRIGSLADGSTTCDFNSDEKDKQHSIDTTTIHMPHKGAHVNLLDTPGYPDYIGAAVGAVAAVETAAIVINASSGIEVNTRRMWKEASETGVARVLVVAKMDGDNVNAQDLLDQIQEQFGDNCIPFNLPVGQAGSFAGVENTLIMSDSPQEVVGDLQGIHDELVEAVVESDDDLMEQYLDSGEVADADLSRVAVKAVATGSVVPVIFCSSQKDIGINEFLDAIVDYCPSPIDGRSRQLISKDGEQVDIDTSTSATMYAQVFKMVTDPFVGKLSFLRIISGTFKLDKPVYNLRTEKAEKIGGILRLQGKEQQSLNSAVAGDIVAVPKLDDIQISDTFSESAESGKLADISFPAPMVSLAVEPKSRKDEQKITEALAKLSDEDATFLIKRDAQINQLVVTGMSGLHLETMLGRLKSRFEVEVNTSIPKVPYKETIAKAAQSHYKHKKQTGGRGQFGEVYLKVEPKERGEGFEFANAVVGGVIPGQYIPAVEKGVRESTVRGVIAGYEFIDVRVTVYDGKHHPVDSSEAAFKIAGSKAFQLAILDANPVLLEPIVDIEIVVPNQFMGDITGDVNSRRGRIMGVDADGSSQIIKAQVPLAEVMSYSAQLRSMTGGEGLYTMAFSHLDVVPGKIADQIKAQFEGHKEEE